MHSCAEERVYHHQKNIILVDSVHSLHRHRTGETGADCYNCKVVRLSGFKQFYVLGPEIVASRTVDVTSKTMNRSYKPVNEC